MYRFAHYSYTDSEWGQNEKAAEKKRETSDEDDWGVEAAPAASSSGAIKMQIKGIGGDSKPEVAPAVAAAPAPISDLRKFLVSEQG